MLSSLRNSEGRAGAQHEYDPVDIYPVDILELLCVDEFYASTRCDQRTGLCSLVYTNWYKGNRELGADWGSTRIFTFIVRFAIYAIQNNELVNAELIAWCPRDMRYAQSAGVVRTYGSRNTRGCARILICIHTARASLGSAATRACWFHYVVHWKGDIPFPHPTYAWVIRKQNGDSGCVYVQASSRFPLFVTLLLGKPILPRRPGSRACMN